MFRLSRINIGEGLHVYFKPIRVIHEGAEPYTIVWTHALNPKPPAFQAVLNLKGVAGFEQCIAAVPDKSER